MYTSHRGHVIGVLLTVAAITLVGTAPHASGAGGEPANAGVITTVAGTGADGSWGDGGPATDAQLNYPGDVAVGPDGSLYIMDMGPTNRVRRVDPAGVISTVVGAPTSGAESVAGDAATVDLGNVGALDVDTEGNLYLGGGHGSNTMVLTISPQGEVAVVAGTGSPGYSGDGGPAIEAELNGVYDLAVDVDGALYISDGENRRVRKVDPSGVITTIAGTGEPGSTGDEIPALEANIEPAGIAVDHDHNLLLADGPRIARIDPRGIITTVAGTGSEGLGDGGPATEAQLEGAEHAVADAAGSIFIEDTYHHRIRKVGPDGIITTVVGTGDAGFYGEEVPGLEAWLNEPAGLAITTDGTLYIADSGNHRVRKVVFEALP
jgi:sugar lactone lactonase YvrE